MTRDNLDFLLRVKLIQQTPYIHFQHNQDGAILRATEVKPKLDEFIRKKMGGDVPEDWLIKTDGSTKALNYKMRFYTTGTPERSKAAEHEIQAYNAGQRSNYTGINGMYFGNMVDKKKKGPNGRPVNKTPAEYEADVLANFKETVFYKEPIKMTILCMIPELKNKIAEVLDEFFLLHNFGCRQTKGFGGFVTENLRVNSCVRKYERMGCLFFHTDTTNTQTSNYKALLNHAMTLYAILKGGLNLTLWKNNTETYAHPGCYIKGYIQRPFLDEWYGERDYMGSDKAFMKQHIPVRNTAKCRNMRERKGEDYRYPRNHPNDDNYRYIRALLGLADHYEFHDLREQTVYVYHLEAEGEKEIQRFPSPITIKIIGSRIFFLFDVEAVQAIVNKTFCFCTKKLPAGCTEQERRQHLLSGWKIKTPERFDAEDARFMMEDFVDYFNNYAGFDLEEFGEHYIRSCTLELEMGGTQQ